MKLLDGKQTAKEVLQKIREKIEKSVKRAPKLVLILIGEHAPSLSYIRGKKKACEDVGMLSSVLELPSSTLEKELLFQIEKFNRDPLVDGILIQMPLPPHIDGQKVTEAIDPKKDVDGFHPLNMGKLLLGQSDGFIPCTPKGIAFLLHRYEIPISGKHVVIVGRSNIVGKPLAALLMQKKAEYNATVTVVHSGSENLAELTRSADILIAAMGNSQFIKKEMVKPESVVIDVGINRTLEGKLIGDVDFEKIASIVSWITPVPGGIGPMTIAMLLQNTMEGWEKSV